MTASFMEDDRLVDLMIQRTIEGLDPDANRELSRRAAAYPDYDDDTIDYLAASIILAVLPLEAPPPHVIKRLAMAAEDWLAGTSPSTRRGSSPQPPGSGT